MDMFRQSAKEAASANELSDFHHVSPITSPKDAAPSQPAAASDEASSSAPAPKLVARPVSAIAGKGEYYFASLTLTPSAYTYNVA